MSSQSNVIESFEVTKGGASGDLLSEVCVDRKLKVGFLACGYFEYWRMYDGLREQVEEDMQKIAGHLGRQHDLFYPGLIDTLDGAEAAGKAFRDAHVDLLIISEGTYCPDYFVHQSLRHLPADTPLICFASQPHVKLDFTVGYDQSLRNSGPMGLVQLTGGFRKMGLFENYEVVVGAIEEDAPFEEIDRIIQVHTTIKNLRNTTIGMVGHVFRGMYDFNFDKTTVSGKLGPHIMDIHIEHLAEILDELEDDDERITALCQKVESEYKVVDLADNDIFRGARLAIALQELVRRYKLNGLVLLAQHHIEVKADTTCYLGLSEILSSDLAMAVTEGDVLGCIMSKVMKDFTGHTPFFGEWEEIDQTLNAVMLLGHGFVDPREGRTDRPVQVNPACEDWGFKGKSLGFQVSYPPGPVTMTHIIEDTKGWRLLISEGELLDTPPLNINESSMIVQVEKPIKEYFKSLMQYGFSHHSIVAPGNVSEQLECFARQLDLEVCRL
jgi:L-arabinose isomerase